jgi:hypothetical protein
LLKEAYKGTLQDEKHKIFTYVDLFRFASLRRVSLVSIVLFFFGSVLYFAPLALVAQFGFNFFLNGLIVHGSQLPTFFFSILGISYVKRKYLLNIFLLISLVCSVALTFFVQSTVCTVNCWNPTMAVQLVLFFILRFCVSLVYTVLFIYIT